MAQKADVLLHTRGLQDGVKELLPLSARPIDTFMRKDLHDAEVLTPIWGSEFTNNLGTKFKIGLFKFFKNNTHWVEAVIKNCSSPGKNADSLVYLTSEMEDMNYFASRSMFLRGGSSSNFGQKICRLDDLPKLCTLKSKVWASQIPMHLMVSNEDPLKFMEVRRPQGLSKAYNFKVNWTLENMGPSEGFTPGECIHSPPFGDVEEGAVLVLLVYPNGVEGDRAGELWVNIQVMHLPPKCKQGLDITYKICANGGVGEKSVVLQEGRGRGYKFGTAFESDSLSIDVDVDFVI